MTHRKTRALTFVITLISTLLLATGAAPAAAQTTLDCSPVSSRPLQNPVILGNGAPGSITTAQLQAALNNGGHIFLDQGTAPSVIPITTSLVVNDNTIVDGGGLITLQAQGQTRLFRLDNDNNTEYTLTLQNLNFTDGSTPSDNGAAVYKPVGGPWQAVTLEVINSHFTDNHAIQVEQDGGGGAIYGIGLRQMLVANSSFTNNSGSNGGALYSLGSRQVKIVDSTFTANGATGTDGNPGNGGNGGAIGVDGGEREVVICRSELNDNQGNAFGAGFFSVMYDNLSLTQFTDVTVRGNRNPTSFGFAGGAYIQGGPFLIERSSFIANEADGVGALFIGPQASGEIINSSFYGNTARTSLGGAMTIDSSAVLTLSHTTVAYNQAPGPVAFAGGIQVAANNQVTLRNSILAHNTGGNEFNPWNIRNPVNDGGGNVQFPQFRPNGQAEVAATASVLWAEPLLEPAADNGGFTPTMAIPVISPAVNFGTGIPSTATDQRGITRLGLPDAGAYEAVSDVIFMDGFE